jgi:ribosome-binding factor A
MLPGNLRKVVIDWRIARNFANLPGLNINATLDVLKPPHQEASLSIRQVDQQLSAESCAKFIPDQIIRSLPRLRRKNMLEDKIRANQRVMLVNGSYCELHGDKRPLRPRAQLKTLEKQNEHRSVRQLRTQERLYCEILAIIAGSIQNPTLKSSFWRVTRAEPSSDYQYCVVRWTIDDPVDYINHHEQVKTALATISTSVRYELAQRLSLRRAPQIRFEYEDYTAISMADAIDTES